MKSRLPNSIAECEWVCIEIAFNVKTMIGGRWRSGEAQLSLYCMIMSRKDIIFHGNVCTEMNISSDSKDCLLPLFFDLSADCHQT